MGLRGGRRGRSAVAAGLLLVGGVAASLLLPGRAGLAAGVAVLVVAWAPNSTRLLLKAPRDARGTERPMWRLVGGAGLLGSLCAVGAVLLPGTAEPGVLSSGALLVSGIILAQLGTVVSVLLLGGSGLDEPRRRQRLDVALGIVTAVTGGLALASALPVSLLEGPGLPAELGRLWAALGLSLVLILVVLPLTVDRSPVLVLMTAAFGTYAAFRLLVLVLVAGGGVVEAGPAMALLVLAPWFSGAIARREGARSVVVRADRVRDLPSSTVLVVAAMTVADAIGAPLSAEVEAAGAIALVLAASRFTLFARDAEERDRARREARTDHLTGLSNRRAMAEELPELLERGDAAHLVVVDIDRFKEVNDLAGHLVGDAVLRRLGPMLGEAAPRALGAWRSGGDEFVLLLRDGDAAAVDRLRALRVPLDQPVAERTEVTISVGAARREDPADEDEEAVALLRRADERMYRDKARRLPDRRSSGR